MTQQHPPYRPPAPRPLPRRPLPDDDTVRLPARTPNALPHQRRPADPPPAPPRPVSSGESTVRTWPWLLGIAVLVPSVAAAGIYLSNRVDLPPTPTTLPPRPSASAEPTHPAAPPEIATDGTYQVGPDVVPGTYRSAGARSGGAGRCTWTTRAGKATLDRGAAEAEERQVVEITEKATAFETAGCAPWVKVG